jgi:hypothetical protein
MRFIGEEVLPVCGVGTPRLFNLNRPGSSVEADQPLAEEPGVKLYGARMPRLFRGVLRI